LLELADMVNSAPMKIKQNLFGKISDKKLFWVITGLCAFLYIIFLGMRALWDPGESRYGLIAAEMLGNKDFIVPTLNKIKYFEKPPLVYWLNAASMFVFGINEFAARLPTAIGAILTVIGTYFFTRRVFSRETAILSSAILFASLGFFAYSQISELEMLFSCFLCWGLGFLIADFERGKRRAIPIHIGYLMLAFACLIKGPLAFALASVIIITYLTITKQWNRWKRLYPFTGIPLALIVTAPWFIAAGIREPEFFKFFFIKEFVMRFFSETHSRTGDVWYYIPILIIAFAPWIVVFFNALKKIWFMRTGLKPHIRKIFIYLIVWFSICFVVFSLSGSKRPPYILPMLPPLAIVTGFYFASIWNEKVKLKKTLTALILVQFFLAIALFAAPKYVSHITPDIHLPLTLPLVVLLIAIISALTLFNKSNAKNLFLLMFTFGVAFNITFYLQSSKLDNVFSRKAMARQIKNAVSSEDFKIYSYHAKYERNMQSMGFYTGKRVYIVGGKGELEFGSTITPDADKYFPSEQQFYNEFKSDTRIFVVLKKERLNILKASTQATLYPAKESYAGKLMLVSNKPWDN